MNLVDDNVILLAGATGRVGGATLATLVREGARVAVISRDRERAQATIAEVVDPKLRERALAIQADLSDPASAAAAVAVTQTSPPLPFPARGFSQFEFANVLCEWPDLPLGFWLFAG